MLLPNEVDTCSIKRNGLHSKHNHNIYINILFDNSHCHSNTLQFKQVQQPRYNTVNTVQFRYHYSSIKQITRDAFIDYKDQLRRRSLLLSHSLSIQIKTVVSYSLIEIGIDPEEIRKKVSCALSSSVTISSLKRILRLQYMRKPFFMRYVFSERIFVLH